jgi:hypothetical protein
MATKKSAAPATVTEPTFSDLTLDLAAADAKARITSADAGQARAERSSIAVHTIAAAFAEAIAPEVVRRELLDVGVLKGTVSKIVTVLSALNAGTIVSSDIKSLNGAYNLVKSASKAALAASRLAMAAASATSATPWPAPAAPAAPPEPKYATKPSEALEVIVEFVKAERDPDKAFKLGGEWITKVTNAITDALKSIGDGDDEEEE